MAIRALRYEDLPEVAALLHAYFPGWPRDESFVAHLARVLIEHPWADDELPSLVATSSDGKIIGFIGSHVRRFNFDGRIIRGVCTSNIVVAAEHRGTAAGALLMRKMLSGPQAFSYSDQASPEVMRMWRAFGGRMDHARCYDWMLVLRPIRWIVAALRTVGAPHTYWRDVVPVGGLPVHAAGGRLLRRAYKWYPERLEGVTGERATSSAIVDALSSVTKDLRLCTEHDVEFLDHLFGEFEVMRGPLVRRLVRDAGRPVGWYAYAPRRASIARVLHVAASPRDVEAVLQELVDDAGGRGVSVLVGRMEPHLHAAVRRRLPLLGFARRPTIHTRDSELDAVLMRSSTLLSQFDGEWHVRP